MEKRGVAAIQPQLDAIAGLKSATEIAPLVARLPPSLWPDPFFLSAGSTQDPDDSEQEIADLDQGGLGIARSRLLHEG